MASGLLDKANIILTPTGYKAGTMYNVAPIESPYEDFDFARASVASRVNSSGLVEMVGITLGSNLVQNGDFSEIGTDLVQNGTFNLGSELVTNGDFATDSDWTKLNATISGGKGNLDGDGQTSMLWQDILTNGNSYKAIFTVSDYNNSGSARIINNDANTIYQITSNGTFTIYFTHSIANGNFIFRAKSGAVFSVDNVSVKEVPDWTIQNNTGTDTGITSGNLRIETDGAYTQVSQSSILVGGNQYKLIYTILSSDNGDLGLVTEGNVTVSIPSSVGTHTYYFTAHSTSFVLKRRGGALNVTIDNVVVQELDPNDYWNLETGWSLGDNQAIKTGSVASNFFQYTVFTTGKTYKLNFTLSNSNDGRLLVYVGGNSVTEDITNASNGTYTFYANSDNVNLVFRNVTFEGSITNVTAQEVIDTNNIPRINYDSNGENGHWLLEPSRTNLNIFSDPTDAQKGSLSYSSVTYQDNFSWDLGSVLENAIVFGDNSTTRYAYYSSTVSSGTVYSLSFFIKMDDNSVPIPATDFLLVLAGTAIASGYTINNYGSNVYRVSVTGTAGASNTANGILKIASHSTKTFKITGFQIEVGSYPTSYIATNGSTVTRATETATGAGSADLINSTEGVLYAEIAALADDGTSRTISLSSGSTSNRVFIQFRSTSGQVNSGIVVSNSAQAVISHTITQTQYIKMAFKWKANDFALWVNGVEVGTDTSGTTFTANTLTELNFDSGSGAEDFYGKCKATTVFNTALTDAELTELTS